MISNVNNVEKFHPGEYVKDALDALQMTSKEFSVRTGISERTLSGLITGKCDITFDIAYKLSQFFDNSIDFWTNLQNQYDIYLKEKVIKQSISDDYFLIKDMKKYLLSLHIIDEKDDKDTFVQKARKSVGVNQLSLLQNEDLLVCYKKQKSYSNNIFYQNFWIALSLNIARHQEPLSFNKQNLLNSLPVIRSLTKMTPKEFYPKLQQIFIYCGINFVLLPYLAKSNIYGITKWLNKDSVVISISNRGEKADLFWFTIAHEIAHVLMGHKREALITFMDVEDKEADKLAEDILISRKEWENYIETNIFTKESINSFSKKVGVHPCIILGRLHKERKVPYGSLLDKEFTLSYPFSYK